MTTQTLRSNALSLGTAGATAAIALCALCFGLVPLFARELQALNLPSEAIALYRYLFTAVVLLPFLPLAREKRREGLLMLICGLLVGLGWIGYLEAIEVAPIAAAGLVYMSYPLFSLFFAWLLLGQRPGRRAYLAGGLVLLAAALLLDPGTLSGPALLALLWSLPAPITFGLVVVVLSGVIRKLSVLERMAAGMLGAVIALAPLSASAGLAAMVPHGLHHWGLVIALGIVTALLPQMLYTYTCPKVGPARSAAAGSFELPTMLLVGWLAFGESLGLREILAAGLVLAAILLSPTIEAKRRPA